MFSSFDPETTKDLDLLDQRSFAAFVNTAESPTLGADTAGAPTLEASMLYKLAI